MQQQQQQQQQQRCDDDDGRTTASKSSPNNKKDDTVITSTSTTNTQHDGYKILAMVPRGLQDDIINQIVEYHNQEDKNNNCNDAIVEFSILDENFYKDYGKQALERYIEQQQLKEQRMKEHFMKNPQHQHNNNNHQNVDITSWLQQPVGTIGLNPNLYVSFGYINEKNQPQEQQQQQQQQQSIISKSKEEDEDDNYNKTNPPPSSPPNIQWTGPGQLFGSVWLQVNYSSSSTKNPSSMLSKIDSIISLRCLGSTLSLIRVGSLMDLTEAPTATATTSTLTLEELTKRFTAWISTTTSSSYERYRNEFQLALEIWKYHVQSSWKDQISKQDYEKLQQRIHNNQIQFRVSCIREMPLGSSSSSSGSSTAAKKRKKKKKNKGIPATVAAVTDANTSTSTNATTQSSDFTRQDIVSSIMDNCSHLLIPGYVDDSDDKEQNENSNIDDNRDWQVDLINYDVEVVIVLTAQMTVAIGISLQPYSYLKSKSFQAGTTPTDITPPYIGSNILSKGIVRLRPTTAHTLLHIADCRPYDIVLDPCAGIGTIPIEADKYYNNNHSNQQRNRMIGLGGDIVLHHPQITTAASVLEETAVAGISSSSSSSSPSSVSSSLLAAWDATYIPVRTGCVDVVLSDLPFGQQCLSASTLNQLLPLILRQCARVLVPNTGRMVVLCGSPHAICKAIEDSCSNYWVQPCTRISPINIGGIIAWIVRVERNEIHFHDEIDGNEKGTTTSVEETIRMRVRKVAQRRDRISEFQKSTPKNEIKKRRLVQS